MNIKLINHIGNITLLAILILGIMQMHWASVFIGALILTIIRILYIQVEQRQALAQSHTEQSDENTPPKAPPAPAMVRNVASFITAMIMSSTVYGIGYALAYLYHIIV